MAAPHVAGYAALALSNDTNLVPAGVSVLVSRCATSDIIQSPGSASPNKLLFVNRVASSECPGFANSVSWTGAGTNQFGWHVGDFDGDGDDDIFRYRSGESGADVFLSDGSRFVRSGSWTAARNGAHGWYVGDFDGRRGSDLLRYI
jgi:hypothetical protein